MKIGNLLWKNLDTALLTLFLVLFSFGQLQRWQLTQYSAVYIHDFVIIGFILLTFWREQKNKTVFPKIQLIWKKILQSYRLEAVWVLWIGLGMLIGAGTGQVGLQSLLYVARLVTYGLFYWCVMHNRRLTYAPRWGLAVAGVLIAFWGLGQYGLLPDTRFLHIFGWDNHYYRLISTLFDPAFTGIILVMTFGWWSDHTLFPKASSSLRKALQVCVSVAIAATFSRASYLAFLSLLVWQSFHRTLNRTFLIAIVGLFALTLWLLPKPGGEGVNLTRTSTAQARWSNTEEHVLKLEGWQWVWGRGLFNENNQSVYETPSHAKLPDSLPVLVLNAGGVVGVLLTLAVLTRWLRRWQQTEALWTGILLAVLVHSLFNNTLLQPFVLLALLLGKITNQRLAANTGNER